jgi:hypothetical protein
VFFSPPTNTELHFVDHSGTLSVEDVAALLERRARMKEMTYDAYEFEYLPTLRARASELVDTGVCSNLDQVSRLLSLNLGQVSRLLCKCRSGLSSTLSTQ